LNGKLKEWEGDFATLVPKPFAKRIASRISPPKSAQGAEAKLPSILVNFNIFLIKN